MEGRRLIGAHELRAASATSGQLVHTLEILLDEATNTSAAARALFLNRHSLLYRIKLIEELTGMSLKNPADRFQLEVSVRVHQINEKRGGHLSHHR